MNTNNGLIQTLNCVMSDVLYELSKIYNLTQKYNNRCGIYIYFKNISFILYLTSANIFI